jgi:UDP-N-acetylglucosamine:LPS N-acetylglucosamine transferase
MKILFIYLLVGGSHYSASKALISKIGLKATCRMVDPFRNLSKKKSYVFKDRYNEKGGDFITRLGYGLSYPKPFCLLALRAHTACTYDTIKQDILDFKPDKIISMNGLILPCIEKVLDDEELDIPLTATVLDPFTAHPQWFYTKRTSYIVFSEQMKQFCASFGHTNISKYAYLINEAFYTLPSASKKKALAVKFSKKKPVILLFGGGGGLPEAPALLDILGDMDMDIYVICGRNKTLENKCKQRFGSKSNVHVLGFVSVLDYVQLADVVISKGGPATVFETLMQRKSLILTSYIWGQEKGNVAFVVDNKYGVYCKKWTLLPKLITEILDGKTKFEKYTHKNDLSRIVQNILS